MSLINIIFILYSYIDYNIHFRMSNIDRKFTFEEKERLVKRIHKLKKNKYYEDVKNIIIKHNPNINITSNPSGEFLYFHDLKNETYYDLNKYLKIIRKKKEISDTSENTYSLDLNFTKNSEDENLFSGSPSLRYSNKERNLIKRKLYNIQLSEKNVNYQNNNSIFMKKKNTKKNSL